MKEYKLGDLVLVTYLTLSANNENIIIEQTLCVFHKIKKIQLGNSYISSNCFQSITTPFKELSTINNIIKDIKYLA